MNTRRVPGALQLVAIAGFMLSCVATLIFLWTSFGGPLPLRAKGYQFKVVFPEAINLVSAGDVRSAGVKIGNVVATERYTGGNSTLATLEIASKYVPVRRDARFVLRQKTLLGETYVEMTFGTARAPAVREGATLRGRANVEDTTQLDEILDTFDPYTRASFRTWQQELGRGIGRRGPDLNAVLGNLPGLVHEAGDLVALLDAQSGALRRLVRNGGAAFEALSRNDRQLRALVSNQDAVFSAIARERESFARIWQVAPTFLEESRLTLRRLQRFARTTDPFVVRMRPALEKLRPTLADLGALSPDLRRLFSNLDPYINRAQRSLPATREILAALRPTFGALAPFLGEFNPLIAWLSEHQHQLTDTLGNFGSVAAAKGFPSMDPESTGHVVRQFSPTGADVQSLHLTRLPTNRGNAYLRPLAFTDPRIGSTGVLPSFDCRNAGGDRPFRDTPEGPPACRTQGLIPFQGRSLAFPHVEREDYFAAP
jgi:phospholipid/cholesterol/gamma-HCH transport system substrate-binding protein